MANIQSSRYGYFWEKTGIISSKIQLSLFITCLLIISTAYRYKPKERIKRKKIFAATITAANISLCSGATGNLPAIIVQEGSANDFKQGSGTLVLQFDNTGITLGGTPSALLTNAATATASAAINTTNNTIEITYNFDATSESEVNVLLINGVTVTASSSFSGTSNLQATSGTGDYTGINGSSTFGVATVSAVPAQPTFSTNPALLCNDNNSVNFVASATGATSYEWQIPAGLTGTSSTGTIGLSANGTAGTAYIIRVRGVNNGCAGDWAEHTVTLTSTPGAAGTISGHSTIYGGESETYTVPAIANADSYTWNLPAELNGGTMGTRSTTTNSITLTAESVTTATNVNISVTGNNSICKTSGTSSANYPISVAPGVSITMPTLSNLCNAGSAQTLGAIVLSENYEGSFKQGNNTLKLALPAGFEFTGTPSVVMSNIDGGSSVAVGITTSELSLTYTFSAASIAVTNSITISNVQIKATGTSGTSVNIVPNNTSTATHFEGINNSSVFATATSVNAPATPTAFTASPLVTGGATNVCTGTNQTYTIAAIAGVTYQWEFPAAMTVTGGSATSETITLRSNTTFSASKVRVRVTNATTGCTSGWLEESITVVSTVAAAGTISGAATLCENDKTTLTVPAISGANSYVWSFTWTDAAGTAQNPTPVVTTTNSYEFTASNIFNVTTGPNNINVTASVQGRSTTCGDGTASTHAITVNRTTVAIANTTTTFSTSDAAVALTATANGSPITTGVFTGSGVNQDGSGTYFFNPATLSAGSYTITCTYTDLATGCTGTGTANFTVNTTNSLGLSTSYCAGDATAYKFKVNKVLSQTATTLRYIHSIVTTNGLAVDVSVVGNNAMLAAGGVCTAPNPKSNVAQEEFHYTLTPSGVLGSSINIVANIVEATYNEIVPGSGLFMLNVCNTTTSTLGSVTINSAPTPSISSVTSLNLCADGTTEHTYQTASTTGHSYQWEIIPASAGDIIGSNTGNQVKVRWNTSGTHQLKVTETNTTGCTAFNTSNFTIQALPTIDFTGNDGSTGSTALNAACTSNTITYTASNTTYTSYAWSISNGTFKSATNGTSVQVQWTGTGTGTLSLEVTNGSGCKRMISGNVTINALSTPNFINSPQTQVCANVKNVTYEASTNCDWTITGGTIVGTGLTTASNVTNVAIDWGGSTRGTITIQPSSGTCLGSAQLDVTINPLPTLAFTGLASVICKTGGMATVNVTVDGVAPTGNVSREEFVIYSGGAEVTRFVKGTHNTGTFAIDFNTPAANSNNYNFVAGNYTMVYEVTENTSSANCTNASSPQNFTIEVLDDVNFTVSSTSAPLTSNYCVDAANITLVPVFVTGSIATSPVSQGYFQITETTTNVQYDLSAGNNTLDFTKLGGPGNYRVIYIFTSTQKSCVKQSAPQLFTLRALPVLGVNTTQNGYCVRDAAKVALNTTVGGVSHTVALASGSQYFEIKRISGNLGASTNYELLTDPTTSSLTDLFDPRRPLPSDVALSTTSAPSDWNRFVGEYAIRFTYTDGNGCKNTSADYMIKVNALPVLSFIGLNSTKSYCNNFGVVNLTPIDAGSIITSAVTFKYRRVGEVSFTNFTTGNSFNTSSLGSGAFEIMFDYTNANGCSESSATQTITIESIPTGVAVTTERFENQNFINFSANSSTAVTSWKYSWTFGDATTSNSQTPTKPWNNPPSQIVNYTLSVNTGSANLCETALNKSYSVDFSFAGQCQGSPTQFKDLSQSSTDQITSWSWDFGDKMGTSTSQNPAYTYQAAGTYWVTLTAKTKDGLGTYILHKRIDIFPLRIVNGSQFYTENFESNSTGWISHGVVTVDQIAKDSTSWKRQIPSGFKINNIHGAAWVTDNRDNLNRTTSNANYNNNEQSYVESPCFDITNLSRPMLSFNYWSDTDQGADGLTILYTIDDGSTWFRLGQQNVGIEWYNSRAVLGSPGKGSTTNNLDNQGWSGNSATTWKTARYSLNEVVAKMNQAGITKRVIRLRMAFGSNGDNPASSNFDGFAFDNVEIGNRNRIVLLEYFTNETVANAATLDAKAKEFPGTGNTNEIISIHHHTDFPGADVFNSQNDKDPGARAFYHGVKAAPQSIIDGMTIADQGDLTQSATALNTYSNRTLITSPFDITIGQAVTSGTQLTVTATVTANQVFDRAVVLHVVVVESSATNNGATFYNITRKMLPDAAGTYRNTAWTASESQTLDFTWDFGTLDPTRFQVVVFVEDYLTKEVHQAGMGTVTNQKTSGQQSQQLVTGVHSQTQAPQISLFPNPTSSQLNVALENSIQENISWEIVALTGKVLLKGAWAAGVSMPKINVQNLAEGVYILRMKGAKSVVFRRFEKN